MNSTPGGRPFRLGIVGAGSIAETHAAAAAALPGVTVAGVCDVRADAARELAARHDTAWFADHHRMLDAVRPDGVIVTAPHALHAPITVDAAAAGVHVLVEKPMATTVADCELMIAACREHRVQLGVGHVLHHLPTVREARRLLGAGDIGRPAVIAERRTAHYAPDARPGWFFDPELAGGGILMNVGAHSIDKIHWLGGAPAERVVARVSSKPGVAVETEAVGLLELANGLAAAISVTGTGLPFHDQTEIVGDDGALRLSRDTGLSVFRAGSGSGDGTLVVRPEDDDIEAAFRDQLADFVDACRSQRPPAVDGAYGRSVVATATAMYQSAARTELVRIAPLASEAA